MARIGNRVAVLVAPSVGITLQISRSLRGVVLFAETLEIIECVVAALMQRDYVVKFIPAPEHSSTQALEAQGLVISIRGAKSL